jgi:GGDEF domain-containing protein
MKLDIELISKIDLDPLKQNLMRFFVHFARLGGMMLVAEGIEREEELRVLMELGVSHGQGFLLGRPGVIGAGIDDSVVEMIENLRERCEAARFGDGGATRVGAITRPVPTCDLNDRIADVQERMQTYVEPLGLAVRDGRRYVGWLDCAELTGDTARTRSSERIGILPLGEAALVGSQMTLFDAMEIFASRTDDRHTLPLVVQEEGEIVGFVVLRELLLAAADANRRSAAHVVPLTGLPSRVQADQWIANRIKAADPCDIAFIDLRDFDAYNLTYGFDRGDTMLVRLVALIRRMLSNVGEGSTFLAHLGEDRFMVALPPASEARLLELVDDFVALRSEMFSPKALEAGYYESPPATITSTRTPLTTLRVIFLPGALLEATDPRALHLVASRLRLRKPPTDEAGARQLLTDNRAMLSRRRRAS